MTPDVSVVVAVYNTADLLADTFTSLRSQTLGSERVQVLLIDDGSTDGSGQLSDEFAATYPGPVEVVHQANSGTPAVPFNRGLDLATGRYVFFLGSDDYLWEEALERLVAAADRWESDVVIGKITGLDGHGVARQVYKHGTTEDLDLFTTALPYALSNAKLFRRSLIESIGLRYREDMRQRCDQPFCLTAIVKGRRTSMLTDADYYFARPRPDRSNVTYTADYDESLHSTRIVMDTIAELIEPGARRDHVMKRQFDISLDRLLDAALLDAAVGIRAGVLDQVGTLADRYLTESLMEELTVEVRIRMVCAQRRDDVALRQVIEAIASSDRGDSWPLVVDGDDVYLALPPFRTLDWPDYVFRSRRRLRRRVRQTMLAGEVQRYGRDGLEFEVRLQIEGLDAGQVLGVLEPMGTQAAPARSRRNSAVPFKKGSLEIPAAVRQEKSILCCTFRIDSTALTPRTKYTPRLRLAAGDFQYDLPVKALAGPPVEYTRRGWNLRRHVVTVGCDASGHMFVECSP